MRRPRSLEHAIGVGSTTHRERRLHVVLPTHLLWRWVRPVFERTVLEKPVDIEGQAAKTAVSAPVAIGASIAAFAVIAVILVAVMGGGSSSDSSASPTTVSPASTSTAAPATTTTSAPTTTSTTTTTTTTEPAGPQPVGADPAALARASVQLAPLMSDGFQCWTGSGTIIDPTGMILTNSHVVASEPDCRWQMMSVAITDRTDSPAEPTYLAEVAGFDSIIDLATLRIVSDIDGNPVSPTDLPFVAVGDSDSVEVGDRLTMFGYPAIGGNTISVTNGIVSGFSREAGIDDQRAWIKTDATISGGNSGGGAIDSGGHLVGIPTTAGIRGELTADCRVLEDTNGDGSVDGSDSCIPIGGFLNGLRPIRLAADVISAVRSGDTADPTVGEDPVDVINTAWAGTPLFGPDVTLGDELTEVVDTLPASSPQVCAYWEYDGMQDGASYDTVWYFDGTVIEASSSFNSSWSGGPFGTWWACATNPDGIGTGAIEFAIFVEGEQLASSAMYVGDGHEPTYFRLNNFSDTDVCYVFISPTTAALWGGDRLGDSEILSPGTWIEFPVTTGQWDIQLSDCGLQVLEDYFDVAISDGVEVEYPATNG